MTGSLIQLVSKGEQDKYLTNNPEISFFSFTYRHHTDFSIETHNIPIKNLEFNNKKKIIIPRIADLLSNMYLVINIESHADSGKYWGWIKNLGINIFDKIELIIGGSTIDTHLCLWFDIWHELTHNKNLNNSYDHLIGNIDKNTNINNDKIARNTDLIIPFMFFFNKLSSLAIPQIAIQFHEIEINLELKSFDKLINSYRKFDINTEWKTKPFIKNSYLLIDYIYLDNTERKIFAESNNEILIDQIQYFNSNINTNYTRNPYSFDIKPNHPCKSFYWVITLNKYTNGSYFVERHIENATKRLIIIILTYMYNYCMLLLNFSDDDEIINTNTLISLDNNNKIKLFFSDNNYTFNTVNDLELNSNYLYFNNLKDVFDINNIRINKVINSNNINSIDYSFITIKNNYIPSHMFSLPIDELFKKSNDVTDSTKNNYPFTSFNRNSYTQIDATSKAHQNFDIKIYDYNNYSLYLDNKINPNTFFKFRFNNLDRIDLLPGTFYNYIQSYDYYENLAPIGLNSFSFALNPMQHQPSGTCNFSVIHNIEFIINTHKEISSSNKATLQVFLLNYNILRIFGGHAGVAFS